MFKIRELRVISNIYNFQRLTFGLEGQNGKWSITFLYATLWSALPWKYTKTSQDSYLKYNTKRKKEKLKYQNLFSTHLLLILEYFSFRTVRKYSIINHWLIFIILFIKNLLLDKNIFVVFCKCLDSICYIWKYHLKLRKILFFIFFIF